MPDESGPHLAIAVLCEKVLREADGVLSIIRIIDRIVHTYNGPGAPEEMPPIPVNLFAVLCMKSGSARGRHTMCVRPEDPSGLKMPEMQFPVLLEGDERGVNIVVNLGFQAKLEGLYWFDVLMDDAPVTRIPLRIVYNPISFGASPPDTNS